MAVICSLPRARRNVDGLILKRQALPTREGVTVDRAQSSQRISMRLAMWRAVLQFTHVANYHAGLFIRNAMFRCRQKPTDSIPHLPLRTGTCPGGVTEAGAVEQFGQRQGVRWPFYDNDRARLKERPQVCQGRHWQRGNSGCVASWVRSWRTNSALGTGHDRGGKSVESRAWLRPIPRWATSTGGLRQIISPALQPIHGCGA